jgi:hypothetical protein
MNGSVATARAGALHGAIRFQRKVSERGDTPENFAGLLVLDELLFHLLRRGQQDDADRQDGQPREQPCDFEPRREVHLDTFNA